MRRPGTISGKSGKARRRKITKAKPGRSPTIARRGHSSVADLQDKLDRRTRERDEALEQFSATSEVLRIISGTPGKLELVFRAMLENATRLCKATSGLLVRAEKDGFRIVAALRQRADIEDMKHRTFEFGPSTPIGRAVRTRQVVHVPNLSEDRAYLEREPLAVWAVEQAHKRTVLVVPMLKQNELIGVFGIERDEVKPFTDKQITLVRNFAAQAVIAIENARLLNELRQRTTDLTESLEQQTATSEVLNVISSSPGELGPVFQAMLENAVRICDAAFGNIYRLVDNTLHLVAAHNTPPALAEARRRSPLDPAKDAAIAHMLETKTAIHIDIARHQGYVDRSDRGAVTAVELGGVRTALAVPMLKENELIGSFTVYRQEPRPFTEKQISLVTNFAAQAVIAIENTRLLNELRESLDQQTATADVLKVISMSSGELLPVFHAVLENATQLCGAKFGHLYLCEGDEFRSVAMHNAPAAFAEARGRNPLVRPEPESVLERICTTKQVANIADATLEKGFVERQPRYVAMVELGGFRALLAVPMLKDGALIGAILIYRHEIGSFSERQVELVQNFAAQAVIAIENARLLNDLQQRTSDLSESLEQQTATADVLRIISSSPGELELVFQAMLANAVRICEAKFGVLFRHDGHAAFEAVAWVGATPELVQFQKARGLYPAPPGTPLDRLLQKRDVIEVADEREAAAPGAAARLGGARSLIAVPMSREGELVGAIIIYRQEVRPFTEKQIELVQNFAAQAVIAIENTRLLNELRQRTADLTESLEQQTATSEVLKIISSAAGDLKPVFDAILDNATRICEATFGNMLLREGDAYQRVAMHNAPPNFQEFSSKAPILKRRIASSVDRAIDTGQAIHILDVATESPDEPIAKFGGARTLLAVPMLKDNEAIGVLGIYRQEVRPFTDKQIALVQNFAAQAVIAIENTRLLNELRQRTTDLTESLEQQTATSKVLDVISRSAFDLQAVFETVAESSVRLCGADRAIIFRFDGELLRMAVAFNASQEWKEYLSQNPIRPGRYSASGRAALERRTVHIPDALADPEYSYGSKSLEIVRTVLAVPILKGDDLLGVLGIYTLEEVRPFTDKQIALLETFADQATIAIDNVRLLDELRHRTDELGRSVGELRALGEVSQAVNSTLDLETVLSTIVAKAVELSGTDAGAIYGYDEHTREFRLRATHGMDQELIEVFAQRHIDLGDPTVASIVAHREPTQVADLREEAVSDLNGIILLAGYRARMAAPLLRGEDIVGMLVVRRRTPGEFAKNTVDIIKTFAAQSALAIQNARLFREIEDKSRQLEEASQHKSQFLANMSHELRTPLNAILGYTELMADGAYGEPSEKMLGILKRLEANGRHLLGLINDVLDLSKIEAGQLVLELSEYSIQDIAQTARSTLEPLAADKKLAFKLEVPPGLPPGRGDGRRLTQVLINLVGNAIKFTDAGEVAIKAEANDGAFYVSVRDTGPGISAVDQTKLFQEFQQADNAITRKKGGTGLGLAISKRIIEMHGGRIWVESQPGQGSTFAFTLPVVVERQVEPT